MAKLTKTPTPKNPQAAKTSEDPAIIRERAEMTVARKKMEHATKRAAQRALSKPARAAAKLGYAAGLLRKQVDVLEHKMCLDPIATVVDGAVGQIEKAVIMLAQLPPDWTPPCKNVRNAIAVGAVVSVREKKLATFAALLPAMTGLVVQHAQNGYLSVSIPGQTQLYFVPRSAVQVEKATS